MSPLRQGEFLVYMLRAGNMIVDGVLIKSSKTNPLDSLIAGREYVFFVMFDRSGIGGTG
jgi:hypothetical protein